MTELTVDPRHGLACRMSPDATGRSYDAIAHLWQQPLLQSKGLAQLERALQFARSRHSALDVGCGSSGRFIALLRQHGFEAEGVDVSEKMIELARQNHSQVMFHLADISTWDLPQRYDFIVAWDSLWHLPLESQEPVLCKLCQGLASEGVLIFTMGGLDEPSTHSNATLGPTLSYSTLGIPKTLELIMSCGCVSRHLEYDQYPEAHVYVIAQKKAS